MKRYVKCSLLLVVCAACSRSTPSSTSNLMAPSASGLSSISVPENFRAHLSG